MPTSTTNYGLIKPETDDPILIGQLNDNMDTVDTVLKDHSDKIDAAALGIKYKGEVNYYADLPNNAEIGDAYTVKYAGSSGTTPDGTEYVWGAVSGVNQWINFSKDSYSKAEVDALLALKQNALSSAQLAAANSGIDSAKVEQIETNKNNISTDEAALVEVVDGGAKNLSDWDGGAAATDSSFVVQNEPITLKKATYAISFDTTANSGRCEIVFRDSNGVVGSYIFYNTSSSTLSAEITLTADAVKFNIFTTKAATITNFMICTKAAWGISQAYQPYRPSYQELYDMVKALQANQ